jgi:nucleoside-diphosphate-sugar epimerase
MNWEFKMRILVTGGMGEIGQPTVRRLLVKGHVVRVLDLQMTEHIPGADCRIGNIMDLEDLRRHMEGIEGVVHLAAYRHPALATDVEILRVNGLGTFQVYTAAVERGIHRIVCASSINVLGYNFGIQFPEGQLRYFPIDEDHPTYITDPYSFSKHIIEEIGAYFWRREGLSSVFLRFPSVYDMDEGKTPILKTFVIECRKQTSALMALPSAERAQRLDNIITTFKQKAVEREWEKKFDLTFPDAYIMFGRSNFWTSLDVRDAADAIERALICDLQGSHAVYVTDQNNFVNLPSKQLADVFFPDVKIWRKKVVGSETLVSIDRARKLFGFQPVFPLQI